MKPPPPLEWHPAYRGFTGLLDWLNGPTGDYMKVCMLNPLSVVDLLETGRLYPDPATPLQREFVLTKRKAWAAAPYVGRPFHYVWFFATDHLGRAIAGESSIVYDDRLVSQPA